MKKIKAELKHENNIYHTIESGLSDFVNKLLTVYLWPANRFSFICDLNLPGKYK